jgi:signal transduction histidine kinase
VVAWRNARTPEAQRIFLRWRARLRRAAPARQRTATAAVALALLVLFGSYLPGGPASSGWTAWGVLACGIFEAARQLSARASGTVCALASSAVAVFVLARVTASPQVAATAVLPLLCGVGLAVPWAAGVLLRLRSSARARERRQLIAWAAAAERRMLMRELHDIAGHALAVSAMQAGVALVALDHDPAQARRSMDAVQLASTRALGELRTLLGTSAEPARSEPARSDLATAGIAQDNAQGYGFAELQRLVDNVRSAGLSVRLRLVQPDEALDPELARVVYRVVQESLTNVIRHASSSRAWVAITPSDTGLRVRIADHGNPPAQVQPGRGLAGMQERVGSVGGRLRTGRAPGGGFLVEALLPLRPAGIGVLAGR